MTLTYGELNLKAIMAAADLDFAHFTYQKNMCSCCYGPSDMSKRYWKDGVVRNEDDDYSYILFKNSNNGSGAVRKIDVIESPTFISYRLSDSQMAIVIKELQKQLGSEYKVIAPESEFRCVEIRFA